MRDLPGFSIEKSLYNSTSSAVYRAVRTKDKLPVVLKFPQTNPAPARQLTRYRNEYEILRSLDSKRVVRAIDIVRHSGSIALVLEAFDGVTVGTWIRTNAPSLLERLDAAIQATAAICDVHAAGLIHKDVNSHNLLINPESHEIRLVDFGIASRLRSEQSGYQAPTALEGTLSYIAPEQTGRMSHSIDQRADLYSLGVTLYEIFSGRLPHSSDEALEIVHFHIAGKPTPLCRIDSAIPEQISDIVGRLLQKSPEDRYQSAEGLIADLRQCYRQLSDTGGIQRFEPGRTDCVNRFHLPERLYGRDADVRKLTQAFERISGGTIEVMQIAGSPGIGKTSLVREIYGPVTQRRGFYCAGKFDQLRRSSPFSALIEALHSLIAQLLTESEDRLAHWRTEILSALGNNGQVITDVIPSLELIIGEQPDAPELTGAEARNRFENCFRRFVQIFAKRTHPLVIFLDDAQWADSGSLNLMNVLLSSQDTEALLLIQSYRNDEEVNAAHPLMRATRTLQDHGVHVGHIELGPLRTQDIRELIAETLHRSDDDVQRLAEVVQQKTGGNAFFVYQFLTSLYENGHFEFSAESQSFEFQLDSIQLAGITDNVAELLSRKLRDLPDATLEALQIAAAIGRRFDIETIARLRGVSEANAAELLAPAIAGEVIVPVSRLESLRSADTDVSLGYRHIQFLHDRLQQSAYESIEPEHRIRIHLQIGRAKLAELTESSDDRHVFDVVSHMNRGMHRIDAAEERHRLAEINLRASKSAKKSTAYPLAIDCCDSAVRLLGGDAAWQTDFELTLTVHEELAEALSLDARHERALEVLEAAFSRVDSPAQLTKLYALKLHAYLGLGDMPAALHTGREALTSLGIALPDEPSEIERALDRDISEIFRRTEDIGFENLLDLPRMESPHEMELMKLMAHCMPAAYQTNQQLFALICSRMVLLSLDSGHCPLSARAYSSFGALLAGVLRNYTRAIQFTRIAIDLAVRLEDPTVLAGVYMVHGLFAAHWSESVDASIDSFSKSFDYGVQFGDHVHAAYSAARKVCYQQFRGVRLDELREQAVAAVTQIENFGDMPNVEFVKARILLMDWLMEGQPAMGLDSPEKSEQERLKEAEERGNLSFASDLRIVVAMHRALAGNWVEALECFKESDKMISFSSAFVTQIEHSFYYALTAAALMDSATGSKREELRATLDTHRQLLEQWSEQCPQNCGHMHLLIAAEKARIDGDALRAMQLYDAAMAAAVSNGFVNIEALAAERAAEFWADREKAEFGRIYVDKALAALETWGAAGKAALLRSRYGLTKRVKRGISVTTSSTSVGSTEQRDALDFATVLKATQALASEIKLDRLVASMISIILENVGGERVVLVLGSTGTFFVQGLQNSMDDEASVMLDTPLADSDALSLGIANYVVRTAEYVVLENPAAQGTFRNDAYIRANEPKSVLCAPIIYKGELRGLVYLENNQVAGAFTPDRLETLNLLMSQIGVSVENAMLYASQENQARRIEQANADLAREITERKSAEAELSQYRDHLEELVRQRTAELESAQGRLVELSRRSGMAEVAAGVLHNVGNVMNSVNVGAHVARDAVRELRIEQIGKVCDQLELNAENIGEYLQNDPAGSRIPVYLRKLYQVLVRRKQDVHTELTQLLEHLEHMKRVIAAQQTYAKTGGVEELCSLDSILDTALAISEASLRSSNVEVTTHCEALPNASLDRHQILQILINLISNARHAVAQNAEGDRRIDIDIRLDEGEFAVQVSDNGIGIPAQNMSRIFNHGFTTKKEGHGFGLHNCANSAQEMGGNLEAFSEGEGKGARFVLRIPYRYTEASSEAAGAA